MDRNDLMFRRQFLLTQEICTSLNHWQHKTLDQFQIYVHPDLELNFIENKSTKLALIGYMIDPMHPERHNIEILYDMIEDITSVECVSKYLYSLSGRFVLVVSILGNTYIFHDPCGLRSVYYTEHEGKIHIGSQPSIFRHIMPLIKGDRFFDYKYSDYYKRNSNHFIPSGCSLYESIQHLIPNHYLQLQNLKQVRYWPSQKLLKRELDDVVRESSDLLPRLMQAGNLRFNLALPLTAGWDSRVLLSACKKIADNIFFYTIQNRRLQSSSADIKIPQKILKKIGFSHHLLDCRKNADESFSQLYRSNVYNAHEYYETIAYGMLEKYPPIEGGGPQIPKKIFHRRPGAFRFC